MKKSLSVVLSATVALSMFSSVAFGKTSADFTDLKDLDAATQAKFDAMISAGIFDGVTDTTFGLKDEMNRAQFAKVAALIMGLDINKDLKTSSFSDVSVDDAANGYALPYIEALKTAGVTDGYAEGQYNPAGKVTKEQLATFLVRVLGKDADAKAKTGTDATVSGWAQGYVALALELKLLANGEDGSFGGMANATRDLLLTGAYEAKQQYVPAGKVSVTGAKATGVQTVTVNFNKPVDSDKAKLALTKGGADVVTTTAFSADKKSAVMTLTDAKISAGEYKVSMSGLDEATVDKTTATFTGENEVLQKIDFVSANDTIAYADKVIVKAKAVNQYGEA
ncbi:S-layer homology domain-containing protein, partial [Paenibacillus sp. SI92]|uniref:S-layer homology domain-containing protein n=1 Tax=Paenibacillus sp. SI92 TaxID=3163027 RepID=UPI00346637DE